jgi:alpha-N-arabinofuranosidase
MKPHLLTAALFASTLSVAAFAQAPAKPSIPSPESRPVILTLDLDKPGTPVSPTLYGLMTEEINHSYDGGIYAELIQNRIFMDDNKGPAHWSVVQDGGGSGSIIALDEGQPLNKALPRCLKLVAANVGSGRAGIANDGFWGIPVKPGVTYRASFYAKSASGAGGPLTVGIESNDGKTVYAQATVPKITGQWQRYTAELTTSKDAQPSASNRFVISTAGDGTCWFNLVSLFPPTWNNRPNGNRIDIMQLLADMKPSFLRFPGGNYLEGDTIDTRFAWKKTLHDLSQRPGHAGCWNYRSSDGMGLLEFLEWCEDLRMQPVLAVYAGYSLKGEHVKPGPALQPFVDEALDEIEYVTGSANTKWGAERVKDGHREPFPLAYVEIGNEDQFDNSHSYDGRFTQFFDAIRAKYPKLQLIATTGVTSRKPDLYDDHIYRNAFEMEEDTHHYDKHDRKGPKIFVGEWATREGAPTTNLNAALGDAAWMTGMERNSDVVVLSCYAPLFVNVNPGGMQWESNLIGYDALHSYGSPSYYAQKMFNTFIGDKVVPATMENPPLQTLRHHEKKAPTLFYVATRDSAKGTIYLKVVNTAGTAQTVRIKLNGVSHIMPDGQSIVLKSADPRDTNTIQDPVKVTPVASKISGLGHSFTHAFDPYSINVLQLETR